MESDHKKCVQSKFILFSSVPCTLNAVGFHENILNAIDSRQQEAVWDGSDDQHSTTTHSVDFSGNACRPLIKLLFFSVTSNTTGHYLVSRIRCMILLRSNNSSLKFSL